MGLNKRLISTAAAAAGSNVVNTENFAPVLYSGNGTSSGSLNPITNVGFQPDLVWIKNRDNADSHFWTDSVRGAGNYLLSNATDAQDSTSRFNSFDSDGFTVSTATNLLNNSSYDYVAWCWKAGGTAATNTDGGNNSAMVSANPDAGFSIITYTGDNANNSSVGHGLNQAPEMFIYKRTSSSSDWVIVHKDVNNYQAYLKFTSGTPTNDTNMNAPTDSVIRFNTTSPTFNGSSQDWLIYAFHSVDGYQKIGTYTGNGNANGTTVTTGFQPRFVMIKGTDQTADWIMLDSERDSTNPNSARLDANSNGSEYTGEDLMDFNSDGFQLKTASASKNGLNKVFIYLAIA